MAKAPLRYMADRPSWLAERPTVRISRRARHPRIVIHLCGRVEVVLPEGADHQLVDQILQQKRPWLERHLLEMGRRGKIPPEELIAPQQVAITATGESWAVVYRQAVGSRFHVTKGCVTIHHGGAEQWLAPLQRWLTQQAKGQLPPLIDEISRETGLCYRKVTIRAQRSRWGSCSAAGNISLNRALLFLSPKQVRYLLIHELCHTVHHNHSPRYWALVEQVFGHDFREVDRSLRGALATIPLWARKTVRG